LLAVVGCADHLHVILAAQDGDKTDAGQGRLHTYKYPDQRVLLLAFRKVIEYAAHTTPAKA
jgi:hypothetical protein